MAHQKLVDTDAEQALIGALFHKTDIVFTSGLSADDLSDPLHAKLWKAAERAAAQDTLLAAGPMKQVQPEIADYLDALVDLGWTSRYDVEPFIQRIKGMSNRRRLKRATEEFLEKIVSIDEQPEVLAAGLMAKLTQASATRKARTRREVVQDIAKAIKQPQVAFKTGIGPLDIALGGGLIAGKMIGIAARSKVGKTVMASSVSYNLGLESIPNLYCALEMSETEIEYRNIARALKINSMLLTRGDNPDLMRRVDEYAATVGESTIYEHRPGASLDDLRQMVASAVINYGIKGFFLDYIQLVTGKRKEDTEEQHMRQVAQWCADYCRQRGIWCVMLAQLNQDGNVRGGEGLKLACDQYYTLHREKDGDKAWLTMELSRYTPYQSVGTKQQPALVFDKRGPFFREEYFDDAPYT